MSPTGTRGGHPQDGEMEGYHPAHQDPLQAEGEAVAEGEAEAEEGGRSLYPDTHHPNLQKNF